MLQPNVDLIELRCNAAGVLVGGIVLLLASTSLAQTGVSEDRVSLPEGPGSLEGVGENISVNPNMGTMTYALGVPLPAGHPEMTPTVALSYNSGGGDSSVGVGWDMAAPFIERMTSRGLPEYTDNDLFAAGGGQQLVQVSDGEPAIYRLRFEGAFVRYKWFERGVGNGGYWVAELPDGKVEYYGADRVGREVSTARVGGDEGVFRYHLVERVDVYGHRIHYAYRRLGTATVLASIGYVFEGEAPRFEVEFDYEDRPDKLSDLKGGFVEVLESRLAGVRVLSSGVQIGRWALSYEPVELSGGMSRLSRVERFGVGDVVDPVVFNFTYSRSLGAQCEEDACGRPYLVEMGENLGFNFQSGNVTLVDINGDALPDIVETPVGEPHRFFINRLNTRSHTFAAEAVTSGVGTSATHLLRAGNVQALDVDGDGLADLLNTRTGDVLENKGQGDWARRFNLFDDPGALPDLGSDLDPEDGDLESIRFFDYDNDKRIDILRSVGTGESNETSIFRNMPGGGFFLVDGVEPLGAGFEDNRLQMADFNGDGLLDLILMGLTTLEVRLNLGRGRWSDWSVIEGVPLAEFGLALVEMEDLNNDGLTDMVLVQPDRVRYALNINGEGFGEPQVITSRSLGAELPDRGEGTTVLFADMNGNGSSDVVWASANGTVTYLEMFTVQPNLLSRIDNSIGFVQTITYSSSVLQAARDAEAGRPWSTRLPHAMSVVTHVSTVEAFANLPEETDYAYTNGHYDGREKAYRGFESVQVTAPGDESSETSVKRLRFDLGLEDPHRAGLEVEMSHEGDEGRLLRVERRFFEDCALEGVPEAEQLAFPVRHICMVRNETVAVEDNPETLWATVSAEFEYDGFGNVVRESLLGITDVGGGGCEPCERSGEVQGRACGPRCLGDEQYRETSYVHPDNANGRWILRAPRQVKGYGIPGSPRFTERTFHYDGQPFVGLPAGELQRGALTRVSQRISVEGDSIDVLRFRRDGHGNVLEELNPKGNPANPESQRRAMTWDAQGLNPESAEQFLVDERGEPYSLRQEMDYDELWNKPSVVTGWVVVRDGEEVTPSSSESVVYDALGRFSERFYAGDGSGDPSERLTYDLGAPTSRVTFATRVQKGRGELDKRSVRCFDGRGRKIQERTELGDGRWLVSEYTVFNANGSVHRVYTAHTGRTGDCNEAPPEGTGYKEMAYDALGRRVRSTWVTAQAEAVERFVHGPTTMLHFDLEDSDPQSPHFETPTRYDYDGLGRQVGIARFEDPISASLTELTYDELNNFRGTLDPQGNEKIQTYDEAGRLVRIQDPDRGETRLTLDANGQVVREVDAAGRIIEREYDGLGRAVARWDAGDRQGTLVERRHDFPRDCPAERCAWTAHRVVEVSFPDGEGRSGEWFGYNIRQQMTFHGMEVRGRRFDFLFEFDNLNRVVQRTFPDNTELDFEWDNVRMVAIPGVVDAFDYGDNGLINSIRYANGVREDRRYDGRLRLVDQVTRGASDDVLLTRGYRYDKMGNLVEVSDERPREDVASAEARYAYDAVGRLTQAHLDPDRPGFEELLSIEYDDIDNILAKTSSLGGSSAAHVGRYAYGGAGPHAVTRAGGVSMAYDGTGAMVQRGEHSLEWDAFGRLQSVRDEGEVLVRNVYGAGRARLLKESAERTDWTLTEHFEIRDGIASIHVIDGPRYLARIDTRAMAPLVLSDVAPLADAGGTLVSEPDAEITVADAWASHAISEGILDVELDEDERLSSPAELLNAAVAALLTEEGQATFFHSDLAGVAMATDAAGAPIGQAVYYPYGQERGAWGELGARGYGGKALDKETGLIDYGARQLDPWLGRWISPDPAFEVLGGPTIQHVAEETGAYVAMINNPTSTRDNDGRFIEILAGAVDHVAGAVIGSFVGAAVGAIDGYQSARIDNLDFGEAVTSALIGGLAIGALGAVFGATSGLVGAATDIAAQSATEAAGFVAGKNGASRQSQLTRRRLTSALSLFAIGAAIGVATVASGGLVLGALSIGGAVAVAGAKLWAIKKAHNDGFSRALFSKFGVNPLTRLLGKAPELVFGETDLVVLQGPEKRPRGELSFSTNADGDVSVRRGSISKPRFKKTKSKSLKSLVRPRAAAASKG